MCSARSVWIAWAALLPWIAACSSRGEDASAARFVVLGAMVVRDGRTGLEWTRYDDGVGLEWQKADAHCRTLSIDGGGWRLPDIAELRLLRDTAVRTPCGDVACAIDPAFTLTSPYVWSATAPATNARTYLDFQFGTALSPSLSPRLHRRTLCVRERRSRR